MNRTAVTRNRAAFLVRENCRIPGRRRFTGQLRWRKREMCVRRPGRGAGKGAAHVVGRAPSSSPDTRITYVAKVTVPVERTVAVLGCRSSW
ncbi:hypothetical protein GCM10010339_42260 [Streptomyces alanosinicus]|uniref:Uncharacterized protein n=1 Tax=Streptomyces alanosinicus TaxID=68171 RepID=A0A919D2M9_9ACTN|nr:hypothetical protein GCM10010339_42260 [Streptomyces alanosinicus]